MNPLLYLYLGPLLFLLSPLQAAEPPVQCTAFVDRARIAVGDRLTYSIVARTRPGVRVGVAAFSPASFEVKSSSIEGPKTSLFSHTSVTTFRFLLTAFTTGSHTLPPAELTHQEANGTTGNLSIPPLIIEVASVLSPDAKERGLRDIKGPLTLGWPVWVYGLLLLLGIGLAIGYYLWKQSQRTDATQEETAPTDARTPSQWALDELALLKESARSTQEEIKAYHISLSEIIRTYLERQFDIPVLDRTTSEVCASLRNSEVEKRHHLAIREFLEQCDLVKFAKYHPLEEEILARFQQAVAIVEGTRPPEPLPPLPEAAVASGSA